jgi:hypothetical protein
MNDRFIEVMGQSWAVVKFPWCRHCKSEPNLKELRDGEPICKKCKRKVAAKLVAYPKGTLLVRDELEEGIVGYHK